MRFRITCKSDQDLVDIRLDQHTRFHSQVTSYARNNIKGIPKYEVIQR